MPTLDTSVVTQVLAYPDGSDLKITWTSTAPAGTWYQVYLDGKLARPTRDLYAIVPHPTGRVAITVGAVPAGSQNVDLSADVVIPTRRIEVEWLGGTYLADDIAGFEVFLSERGTAIDYSAKPNAKITAYSDGIISDGFGLGGFGLGGFGKSASSYSWKSEPVASGSYRVGVRPVDVLGNKGTPWESTVVVVAPPEPPARTAAGSRLSYSYNQSTRRVTLNWLASPSVGS